MKKFLALLLVLVMALGLVACSVEQTNNGGNNTANNTQNDTEDTEDTGDTSGEAVEIALWTYPIGDWGKPEVVDQIIATGQAATPALGIIVDLNVAGNGGLLVIEVDPASDAWDKGLRPEDEVQTSAGLSSC